MSASSPDSPYHSVPLDALLEINLLLNSTMAPEFQLQQIVETTARAFGCAGASILLYEEKTGDLTFRAAAGADPQKLAQIPVPLDRSIAGVIFQEKEARLVKDLAKEPRHYRLVSERVKFPAQNLAGAPICVQDEATGVIEVLNKVGGDFTAVDLQLLDIVAAQAAVAVNQARMSRALRHTEKDLRQIERLKRDFMALASHELRTPLGVILGYATFLKEESLGSASEHADAVLSAAQRLQALVEDMTNMNLLHSGGLPVDLRPTSLRSVLQSAYQRIRATAEMKHQKIVIYLPTMPLQIPADRAKLETIFKNLLDNAVRFSPPDEEILVQASVKAEEVHITVRDYGIGIPPDEIENIFDEFYQAEQHLTRRYSGLGLGLPIAHSLVRMHRGRIWAESEGPGQGATFHVVLPLASE
jgi:signal transduction histidine kinase